MADVGGTPALRVQREQVLAMASSLDDLVGRLGRHAARVGGVLDDLVPTLALSPGTGAAAEAALGV
ncbi:MAG: hypothetical protein QM572_18390, partial [Nocardioides sp.]|uniref:hypothetical protein n=1 Tax=Nocardioides sp. TaxID=35761 RepID=UPI0039E4D007